MSENELALDRPQPGFLLVVLHILIAAAIGNLLYAGGAFLMGIDSRLACLGGLAIVLIAPLVIFFLVGWQTGSRPVVRRTLRSCWLILMLVPPMSSWLCEYLYWHLGRTGIILAFAAVLPILSIVALWWCVGVLGEPGLWAACGRPKRLLIAAFILFWLAGAWLLLTVCLGWNVVGIPKLEAQSLPATISRVLTAFLPTTLLLVFFARVAAGLGRRSTKSEV